MPLDEKQREEKEAYAKKIMAEMKLKNEKLQERYREVQRDRERAEERNSSITTGRNPKREADRDIAPKAKYEREWDRGKPNPDTVEWDSSDHHDYYSRNTRSYSDRRYRKDDSWRSRTTNSSNNQTSSFFSKYNKNGTIPESSTFHNDTNHFNSRSRSQFHSSNPIRGRANTESSYQNSKLHDHSRKFSVPQNSSESKRAPVRHSMDDGMDELMWQCGSMNEVQHKLSRIENWVKSININHGFADSSETMNKKEDYKSQVKRKDLGSHRERPKKYGSVEDSKRSKEQTYFRAKEKSEHKFSASFSRGRGNRMLTGDRCSSLSDSKNQRDGKRKNLNERSRRKCESDMSDRASSMKESDDPDWGKDKIIRARSNSKSSENSCNKEKIIQISEEPSTDLSDENWKSEELTKFESNEKHEDTSKQSVLKQKFLDDDDCKYGSKSLPSYGDSENFEFKNHQIQNFEEANNKIVKDNKFCKNEVEYGLASSTGDLYSGKQSLDFSNCSYDCDQNGIRSSDPDFKQKHEHESLSPSYIVPPETVQNSKSECQNSDNWNEHDISKNSGEDNSNVFETMSKPRNTSFSVVQNNDCVEFDAHNSTKNVKKLNPNKCDDDYLSIISSVYDNSFLNDMNCSDIYKKNLESAENIVIALQCNPKDSLAPHKRKVSVKRYSHKRSHNKTVKLSLKSKLPLGVKVTDEAMEKSITSKSFTKDSHSDLETYDKDMDEPNMKMEPEGKGGLSDDTKLDADDVAASNFSDEWATTDEDEPDYIRVSD